jgi:hypothetical protein
MHDALFCYYGPASCVDMGRERRRAIRSFLIPVRVFGRPEPPCRHWRAKAANIEISQLVPFVDPGFPSHTSSQHALLGITCCPSLDCPGRHSPWPTGADIPGYLRKHRKSTTCGSCSFVTHGGWLYQYVLGVPGFSGWWLTWAFDEDTCLCLSGIQDFLSSNIVAQNAAAIAGKPPTSAALTNLVVSGSE